MLKLRFTLSKAMLFLSSFKASGITFVSLLILMPLSLLLKKYRSEERSVGKEWGSTC